MGETKSQYEEFDKKIKALTEENKDLKKNLEA